MPWDQLLGIVQEAAEIDREQEKGPPTSCAVCYTALKDGPGGTLFCPWDGLKWPEDASAWGRFPGAF